MPELIINADDFGLHPDIDKGIFLAVSEGIVNSVSIIERNLNRALLAKMQGLGVFTGVHIALVELPWLTKPYYFENWQSLMRSLVLKGKPTAPEIEVEVRCQIDRLLEQGVTLSHIDSHQHTHAFPILWSVFNRIGDEYAIPRIRWPHAPSSQLFRKSLGGLGLQLMTSFYSQNGMRKIPCIGLAQSGSNNLPAILMELQVSGASQDLELVLHPGIQTPALQSKYGYWGFDWEQEQSLACNPQMKKAIDERGFSVLQG